MSRAVAGISAIVAWGVTQALAACPLCAENLSKDLYGNQPNDLARGFFWSIMLMMALPFTLAGTVAWKVRRARRRPPGPSQSAR
jgi:heme/copper-type cytochrome/quinol oxidase subunit 2